MTFSVILAAGGSGSRLGSVLPKAFVLLAGKPLLSWSIPAFQAVEGYSGVIAAVPEKDITKAQDLLAPFGGKVVAGGKRRQDSVLNALNVIDKGIEIAVIHDAARPLVSSRDIEKTIKIAEKYGGAVLSRPVTDTIKKVEKQVITGTEDRAKLWRAETPQVFKIDILKQAYNQRNNMDVTDDAQLVSAAGFEVRIVQADRVNPKITFPEDLIYMEKQLGVDST